MNIQKRKTEQAKNKNQKKRKESQDELRHEGDWKHHKK
jgi:hypothetical protein